MQRFIPLVLVLTGCPVQDPTDTEQPDTEACEVGIEGTYPTDGSSDAYYRGAVEFYLSEPDPTATVVAAFDGEQTTRDDGLTIVYTPTQPLEPTTAYEVSLDYCRGTPSISFTTSVLGEPIDDPGAIRGRTWAYDLRDARFYQAGYLGDLLQTFAERVGLVSFVAIDGDTVDLRLAVADDNDPPGQDYCARTVDIRGVDFSSTPYFEFGPTDMEFNAYLGVVTLHEMTVQTTVAPNGAALEGMVISAVIDVRSVSDAVDMDTGELCELLEVYGAPCEPCPEDAEPFCVSTAADRLGATAVAADVERIPEAYTDPRCEEVPPEDTP